MNWTINILFCVILFSTPLWADGNPRAADPLTSRPAIQGLRISNDRWPDSYTLRSFAESVIRIERARTEEEQAVALYNWIARTMTIGGPPHEGAAGHEVPISDTLKILNVYGNHWCDGQGRLFETMWRSLGRQAHRLYLPMRHHSLVELWWRDIDGTRRAHALDVNNGWWVRNEQGWIASSEDIERNPLLVTAANQDLKMRTKGWLRTHLSLMPEFSMAIYLHRGERYTLLWDNQGIYYVNPGTQRSVSPESNLYQPGGPYSQFIGGGEAVFSPELGGPVSSFTHQFDFPYLIADATVEATVHATGPQASAAIAVSTDGGQSWSTVWSPAQIEQERLTLRLPSVRGLYSYLLSLESGSGSSRVLFADMRFTHRVMMNKMTLPNLQPGWNRFKVDAQALEPGSALRITVEWTDKEGLGRVERAAARLPFEFNVFANASGGATVRMRSLRLEVIPVQLETRPSGIARLKSGSEAERIQAIIEAGLHREEAALGPLIESLQDENEEIRYWAADSLGKLGDSRAVPALISALRDPFEAVRMAAGVALGDLKAKEAVPALLDLVSGKTGPGKGYGLFAPVEVGAGRWMAARAVGRIGDPAAVPTLAETLRHADGDLGFFVAEALGELGDRGAVPALLEAARKESDPARRGAVEALGRIGDPTAVPLLIHLLQRGQEDVRLAAAAALGRLGDQRAVAALKKTSQTDVVESVRDAALAALEGR